MKVRYQGKIYQVLAKSYLGNNQLYKLESRTEDGSPFGAKKDNCIPIYYSTTLKRYVTIPTN
jgi:hypothetical protein